MNIPRSFPQPGGCIVTAEPTPDCQTEWLLSADGVRIGVARHLSEEFVILDNAGQVGYSVVLQSPLWEQRVSEMVAMLAWNANVAPNSYGMWIAETSRLVNPASAVNWMVAERHYQLAPRQPHCIYPKDGLMEGQLKTIDQWSVENADVAVVHRNEACPILGFETRAAMMAFLLVWQGQPVPLLNGSFF